jgi:hypothetical protein
MSQNINYAYLSIYLTTLSKLLRLYIVELKEDRWDMNLEEWKEEAVA